MFLRYLSFEEAMKVCSELGDLNSHLVPFDGPEDFEFFYEKSRLNPAVQRYCNHGNRKMFWLPYRNRYWQYLTTNWAVQYSWTAINFINVRLTLRGTTSE